MSLHLAIVSLGDDLKDITTVYEHTRSPALTLLVYFLWVIVSLVLLINLLGDLPCPAQTITEHSCVLIVSLIDALEWCYRIEGRVGPGVSPFKLHKKCLKEI